MTDFPEQLARQIARLRIVTHIVALASPLLHHMGDAGRLALF